jgi:hypothetical protein
MVRSLPCHERTSASLAYMETFQARFHHEWQHLQDPHVRSLAWILTSPGLLARHSPLWQEQVASLALPDMPSLRVWLALLDQQPSGLHEALNLHKQRRLGHYAENLLGFYLRHHGLLYAHGLQVHDKGGGGGTVGEFDFLLHQADDLLHWEIATKFYLLETGTELTHAPDLYDYLGPNLADTLGSKMEKIFRQQLLLSQHPEAQKILPKKVVAAKALIMGWLFYRQSQMASGLIEGLSAAHCRGYWWTLDEIEQLAIPHALILSRLEWLAPAQCAPDAVMGKADLRQVLQRHFLGDKTPLMLAIMSRHGNVMQEFCRGMVVPDDWLARAGERRLKVLRRD